MTRTLGVLLESPEEKSRKQGEDLLLFGIRGGVTRVESNSPSGGCPLRNTDPCPAEPDRENK